MRHAVQQRGGHFRVAEYLWPFAEVQVCRYDQRNLFVELGYGVKKQLSAVAREGKIAQLVQNQAVVAEHLTNGSTGVTRLFFSFKLVHKVVARHVKMTHQNGK